MHISDVLAQNQTTFSFEFFPPKSDEASERLYQAVQDLAEFKPAFVSVTYGAGGGTRERTHDLVVRMKQTLDVTTVPHLTCVCHSQAEIQSILERYAEAGICNILALAGDPPQDKQGYDRSQDAFGHAAELVQFIRDFQSVSSIKTPDPRGFGIGVAGFPEGHPRTPNRLLEMDYLKAKVDAGADYICTQLFFDNRDFYDFRERCELAGIHVPIIAGVMPIVSGKNLKRMAELSAGSRFPASLLRAINRCEGDDERVKQVGVHWATEQCRDLLDHQVKGIHFYTLNQSSATRKIYEQLGMARSGA